MSLPVKHPVFNFLSGWFLFNSEAYILSFDIIVYDLKIVAVITLNAFIQLSQK